MANPFPFTAGQVLTAAQMNGIGESAAFTPSWTNVTVGNATQAWRYVQVQKLVFVQGNLVFGSTTSISGNPTMTLPVTAVAYPDSFAIVGNVMFVEAGIQQYAGIALWVSTTTVRFRPYLVSGTQVVPQTVGASTPFTWATGDQFQAQFVYEAA